MVTGLRRAAVVRLVLAVGFSLLSVQAEAQLFRGRADRLSTAAPRVQPRGVSQPGSLAQPSSLAQSGVPSPSGLEAASNPGTTGSAVGGWRGVANRGVGVSSLPVEPGEAQPDPGLGGIIRPAEAAMRPVSPPSPSRDNRAGTPVPEHYYRQDWRRDPKVSQRGPVGYPRYFGAFHSSHYYDLGIPNGDKGLRGNGIYWTPW